MRNGEDAVEDSDVHFYACTPVLPGAYYPNLHWDTDWYMFPRAAGFQLWYVTSLHQDGREERQGNMFLGALPRELAFFVSPLTSEMRGGNVSLHHHTTDAYEPVYKSCSNCTLEGLGIRLHYLDAQPGDILVFSKRQMHMSDPRPTLRGVTNMRKAAHGRFVVKSKGEQGIRFWTGHPYVRSSSTSSNLAARGRHWMNDVVARRVTSTDGPNHKIIEVKRYEMMGVRHSAD